jgi:hypothetical protein
LNKKPNISQLDYSSYTIELVPSIFSLFSSNKSILKQSVPNKGIQNESGPLKVIPKEEPSIVLNCDINLDLSAQSSKEKVVKEQPSFG